MTAVAPMRTEVDARRHLTRIRLTAGIVRENMPKLQALIDEARDCGDDRLLGYASWTAYVSDAFSDEPMRLPREERQQLVAMLAGEGMSTRAIAPIVGASHKTVARDIGAAPVSNDTPEANPVSFADQIARDVEEAVIANPQTGEVIDASEVGSEPVPTAKPITGLDGKSYSAPVDREPRRRSLVDDAYKANTELWKAIERIRAIRADDRFTRNKADILAALQPSVDLASEVISDLGTTQINQEEK